MRFNLIERMTPARAPKQWKFEKSKKMKNHENHENMKIIKNIDF